MNSRIWVIYGYNLIVLYTCIMTEKNPCSALVPNNGCLEL